MRTPKILLAAMLTALALPTVAQAQTPTSHYTYDFEPDDLVGDTLSTTPPLLKIRAVKLPRIMLIRPRASFVAEMLQSVQGL
jgi:hypothetical protein